MNNTPLFGGVSSSLGDLLLEIDSHSAAVNYGELLAQGGIGVGSISINDTVGEFGNNGSIIAGSQGSIDVSFAPPVQTFQGSPHQMIGNTGSIVAENGGVVSFNAGHAGGGSFGFVFNQSAIIADGGMININSDLLQLPSATTFIHGGGTVTFNDGTSQGTVEIDNGTAAFGFYAPGVVGPVGAIAFNSMFNLVGDAKFNFSSTPVTETFDIATQKLTVFETSTPTPQKLATWQVESTAYGALSATDFSNLNPTTIAFHHG